MAKGKKTGGKAFAKGNKLGGRKPESLEEKAAKALVREKLFGVVALIWNSTEADIRALDIKTLTIGERAVLDAYRKKNYLAIKTYEDRVLGKAKESIELTGEDGGGIHLVINSAFLPMVDSHADQS